MGTASMEARTLLRGILRMHRQLPPMQRQLGDRYVLEEFRQHKTATPQQAKQFMEQWGMYRSMLNSQLVEDGEATGAELADDELARFNGEQKAQLDKLREQAEGTDSK